MLESKSMNQRAYYTDSYTTRFTATIVDQWQENENHAIVLDRTYFYPTSGGQPHDTGSISDIPVMNVLVKEENGQIVHYLPERPQTSEVTAVVDWQRRFDHMQQHTGQHILSQAIIQLFESQTIGFHLGEQTITIDLDSHLLSQEALNQAEDLANTIIWQDRPVIVRWATRQEVEQLPLRKIPANGETTLRLIDILNFDLTACGGTHVARTGEVGQIKVIKQEVRNKKARIHFLCGFRALRHFRSANATLSALMAQLTTGQDDLLASITRMQEAERETRRSLKRMQNELDQAAARQLLQQGTAVDGATLVIHILEDEPPNKIRGMAKTLASQKGIIALLGTVSDRTHLVFSRSEDAPGSMNALLQQTFLNLGSGSGGGSDLHAQGAAENADPEAVREAMWQAARSSLQILNSIG